MKNIHISEVISRKELSILNENDSLNTYLNLDKQEAQDHYILNDFNILTGIINEKAVLQFISPMLCLIDQQKGNNLMKGLKEIPVSSIANKSFTALNINDNLSDILVLFAQTTEKTLPVVDELGQLSGNVTIQSVLNRLSFDAEISDLFREKTLQVI